MSSSFHIDCYIWDSGVEEPEDELSPYVTFSINFLVAFTDYPVQKNPRYKFCVERDRLIDDNKSRSVVEGLLSAMHLPADPFSIDTILNHARKMASDKCFMNRKALWMNVCIFVDNLYHSSDSMGDIAMDPDSMGNIAMVPKLATVEVKDSMKESCAVCFEELLVGSMAKCMSCQFEQLNMKIDEG